MADSNTAIVLLAGGEARRFPGKLEQLVDGRPLLQRCFDRLRASRWPVYLAGKGTFCAELDRALDAPLLIDRHPGGGPLAALFSACTAIRAERIFAVAADQPNMDAGVLERMAEAWEAGDEAIVPRHDGGIEPLAALYSRRAVLREGSLLRRSGASAMRDLIERIAARFVSFDARHFHNVNYARDLA